MNNLDIWNNVKTPPPEALKEIKGGRLNGMTDIRPQWRYEKITEQFGPCGIGWKFEVTKLWLEPCSDDQVAAFANINLYYKYDGEWSEPIPGNGGSMFIKKETRSMHSSDEVYKMAITDALGGAAKMIGVAADVYSGRSKYSTPPPSYKQPPKPPANKPDLYKAFLLRVNSFKSLEELQDWYNQSWDIVKKSLTAEQLKKAQTYFESLKKNFGGK